MRLASPDHRRPTRREFLVGGAAVASAALLLDAFEIDRHHLVVEHRTVRIARLSPAFHGFRIAQLSDFHYSHYVEPWFLREAVAGVNALAPDMVALTGDFITADGKSTDILRSYAAVVAEILAGLTCPLRFCSLGNHDSIDPVGVTTALERNGLHVLNNQYAAVNRGGERLWVGGLADAMFGVPDFARSIPRKPRGGPVVLLGHEPDVAASVETYGGVDLMLAGHTHGGQVRLPFVTPMFLPDLGRRYLEGMYRVGALQLNVNRGLGTVHLPIRFRCPPELTLLTLQPS